jgi:hypothetical protein
MDLGDRGGGHRLVVEAFEQFLDRAAELFLDDPARLAAGKGRQAVLKLRQIGGDRFPDQIGPGRQDLPQLDEAGSQFAQRRRQPLPRTARYVFA